MKRLMAGLRTALCCGTIWAGALVAQAFPIQEGDLIVVQIGDGSIPLANTAFPTFLREFQTNGAPVQTIPLPTTVLGPNKRLTNSGSATSEGILTLSDNGQYLILGGYDAAVGTAAVASSTSVAVNRVIARIDMNGVIDTTTALNDAHSGNNIRSATSFDGLQFWTGGAGNGCRYALLSAATSTQIPSNLNNMRVIQIFQNQLYSSSASGTFQGLSKVGVGLPVGSSTVTALPGFPVAAGPSNYDYYFASPTRVYVADDRNPPAGGIQRWDFNGANWTLTYTLNAGQTFGCRGLTGTKNCQGQTQLYATTAEAALNRVVTVIDTGVASAFTTLTIAAPNTIYRGCRLRPRTPAACCLPGNTCAVLTADCCISAGGTPQAAPTCTPDPCQPAVGACCTPSGCVITTHVACEPVHCFYYGDGSICPDCDDNDPCTNDSCNPVNGACVHTPIDCDDNDPLTDDYCVAGDCHHDYRGGACCAADGSCEITREEDCTGLFQGVDSTCTPNPCPQPLIACCLANGSCQEVTADGCTALGGSAHGASCATANCPQPPRACCLPDAQCFFVTPAECDGLGGESQAVGTTCSTGACFVACCFDNGLCQVLQRYACVNQTGTPGPYGSICTPGLCPNIGQACCFAGGCVDLTPANCIANAGTPQGPGTSCGTTGCPPPLIACCYPDGSCQEVTTLICTALGGTVSGPSCATANCFVDRCLTVLAGDANCDGSVNNFDIDFFVQGVLFPAPPGDFTPAPPAYTIIGGTQACWESRRCWGDVNCDGAFNNFDIDAFVACVLATPQPGLGCPSCGPQACCLPGGGCQQVRPAACTLAGGSPQGPGSNCGTVVCP